MPFNTACAGKIYPQHRIRVRAEEIRHFALAMQEDNPHFTDEQRRGGIMAPPMFAAVLAFPAVEQAIRDPGLGVPPADLVPVDCEFQFLKPIRPVREIFLTASLEGFEREEEGEVALLHFEATRQRGRQVFQGRARILHREDRCETEPPKAPQPVSDFLRPSLAFRTQAQAKIASPLLRKADRGAPFSAPGQLFVNQTLGLAHAAKAITDNSVKRDPTQLKRIAARLVRSPRPGEILHTAGWIMESRRDMTFFGFEVIGEDASVILADGSAEVVLK